MNPHFRNALTLLLVPIALAGAAHADNRVLVIGIDGLGGSYLQSTSTPQLDALAAQGAVRYDWLNEGALVANPPGPYGSSGVNWSTILTGASAASHGVSDNSFVGNNFANFPHWFKHAKAHDPSLFTASIVSWAPINEHVVPDAFADLEFAPTAQAVVDKDAAVRDEVVDLLSTGDPDAIFVHFDQVDVFGHSYSWGNAEQVARIEAVDGLVGEIMATLNARAGVVSGAENWLVMVTADHGAAPGAFIHSASQGPSNWQVPLVISGPSVPDGAPLAQGTLRDIATTALFHLGVDLSTTTVEGKVIGIVPEPTSASLLLISIAFATGLVPTGFVRRRQTPEAMEPTRSHRRRLTVPSASPSGRGPGRGSLKK